MPHSPATGILLAASAHLYATLPGAVQPHELSTEYGPTPEQLAELLGPSVLPHDGTLTLTDAPGLGLELDERVLARLLGPADGAVSFARPREAS
jgi:L-alanine-DL-glutamate epimerase-like enolase superfamily enzyme